MEEWKRVVIDNIEWNYEVSTEGKIRNVKTGKILKQCDNGIGYLKVCLSNNKKTKTFYVHRLVLETFEPTDDKTLEVNHINENKHDNRLENLEWLSHKNNTNHGTRTERSTKARSKKVICIETGIIYESTNDASRKTGLHQSHIVECCKGKYKTCGGFHWEYVD